MPCPKEQVPCRTMNIWSFSQYYLLFIVRRSFMGGGRSGGAVGQGLPMGALCMLLVKQVATLIRCDEQSALAGWTTQSNLLSGDVPAAPEIKL